MESETLAHLPIAAALVAAPLATLAVGWRFVVWIRDMIRDEIRPLRDKVDRMERDLYRVLYPESPIVTPVHSGPVVRPHIKEE